MIEIKSTLTLRCAKCRRALLFVAELEPGEFSRAIPATRDLLGSIRQIIGTAEQLRELAQRAGWTYILPTSQDAGQDLCDACFQLPPEG